MSGRDPGSFISEARVNYSGIGDAIAGGFMGVIVAGFTLGIDFAQATQSVLTTPLRSLGTNLGGIVDGFVGGAAGIMEQGATTAIMSIAPGQTWAIGPLTYALGIGTAGSGLFAMAYILQESPTSDLIPFSFTDFPLLGVDEGNEEFEE